MKKTLMMILFIGLAVSMMWGQTYLLQEGFATTSLPSEWSGDVYFNSTANIGNLTGNNGAGFNATNKYLQLPALNNVSTLSFWMKGSASASQISMKVQKKVGTGEWTDVASFAKPHTTDAINYTVLINDSRDSVVLKFVAYDRTGNSLYLDDVEVTQYSSSPTIVVSPTSLSDFSYVHNNGPSDTQTFTVSGSTLTADISIAASTNYEISEDGITYGLPITLIHSGGSVSEITIYVRLKASLGVGTYNIEAITASSSGADDASVTCNGEVTKPPAPAAPLANSANSVTESGFTANWNSVEGATSYEIDVYTKTDAPATDLFISEYVEGSSNNKYIEVFNGTGLDVDLSDYRLQLYANGASSTTNDVLLSGILANGECVVYQNSSAVLTMPDGVIGENSAACNFNGDDAVALYKISTGSYVDIFGRIGNDPGSAWTGDGGYTTVDKTLTRKPEVFQGVTTNPTGTGPTAFTTLTTEWDMHDIDTATNLGAHTMHGGSANSYVSELNGFNVGSVTSYSVTGLNPEITYYYVVRAIDAYNQSSTNSSEISVTTTAAYDYPEGESVSDQGVSVVVSGGSVNTGTMAIPPVANTGFTPTAEFVFVLDTSVLSYTITIQTEATYGAYYLNEQWNLVTGNGTQIVFTINPSGAKGEIEVPIILGDQDPTLPVELSSFTAMMSAQNYVGLSWITQSETNVRGYHVYRSNNDLLETALLVSPLINAANTSTQQSYYYEDREIHQDGTYYYWLENVDFDGSAAFHGPISITVSLSGNNVAPGIPLKTELGAIYPNPFNPSAWVSFGIARPADVVINIYNARGQLVRSLLNENRGIGYHRIKWDGKDDLGSNCGTGIYYIRMQADADSFVRKALLMK